MKPIVRIGFLIDQHEDWHRKKNNLSIEDESISFKKCPGCEICDEINRLSLANGLKTKDKKDTKVADKPKEKVVNKVPKITFTYEEYKKLREQGLDDKTIAKRYGVTTNGIKYKVKKWEEEERRIIKPVVDPDTEKREDDYMDKILKDSKDVTIEKLIKEKDNLAAKVQSLEEKLENIEAAANDTEKEAAAALEYLEKEQQLLLDVEDYKLQALTYQAENVRLNQSLADIRKDANKYKGDAILFRNVLKAVL